MSSESDAATVEGALAVLSIDDNTKNIKLMNLIPDLRHKVLDQMSLMDLQQLRCTSSEVCEFIDTHAKGLKSVRNLELVRLRDEKCWWYSAGVEGEGDHDYQRRGSREWSEGLQHLRGIHASAIRIESEVTDELLLALQKSRLTCVTLVLRDAPEPLIIQQLVSLLRPISLFFEDQEVVDLTEVVLNGIDKLCILDADTVVGKNIVTDTRSVSHFETSTRVTDHELNKIIREWLRYERKIDRMKFETAEGTGDRPFSYEMLFLGVVEKKQFSVTFESDITDPDPLFLVERTDTEALLLIMGQDGMVTFLGPSDLTCQYYQQEQAHNNSDVSKQKDVKTSDSEGSEDES